MEKNLIDCTIHVNSSISFAEIVSDPRVISSAEEKDCAIIYTIAIDVANVIT